MILQLFIISEYIDSIVTLFNTEPSDNFYIV